MNMIQRIKQPFWVCLALGLLGAGAVLLAADFTVLALGAAAVLAAAGAGAGVWVVRSHAQMVESIQRYVAGQADFTAEVVPIWKGHIDT